jgi:hypothetical protein
MRKFRVRISADGLIEAPNSSEAVERMLTALPKRPTGTCDITVTVTVNVADVPAQRTDDD